MNSKNHAVKPIKLPQKSLLLTSLLLLSSQGICIENNNSQPNAPRSISSLLQPASGANGVTYTFHSTVATDSINYIQLSNCTDNTCGSCDAPYQIYTAGSQTSPITITSGGTSYSISPAAINYYLHTYGGITTASNTYYMSLYVQSTTENCSSNTAYCSADVDSTTHKLCIQATYSGTSTPALTQQDNGNVTLSVATKQYVYIADETANTVYSCTVDNSNPSTGELTCSSSTFTTPSSFAPQSITIATVHGTQYAYISRTSNPGDANNNIYYCAINNDGTLNTTCTSAGANIFPQLNGGSTDGSPYQIAFATIAGTQYAYVAGGHEAVYRCNVNSGGNFTGCTLSGGIPDFSDIYGITVATIPDGTQNIYLTDRNGNMVYRCTPNTLSTDLGCSYFYPLDTPTPISTPQAISFAMVNNTQYAYIGSGDNTDAYYCQLNPEGGLSESCNAATAPEETWYAYGVTTLISNGGKQYMYVATKAGGETGTNSVYLAALGTDGVPGIPLLTGTSITWNAPNAIASAYVAASVNSMKK